MGTGREIEFAVGPVVIDCLFYLLLLTDVSEFIGAVVVQLGVFQRVDSVLLLLLLLLTDHPSLRLLLLWETNLDISYGAHGRQVFLVSVVYGCQLDTLTLVEQIPRTAGYLLLRSYVQFIVEVVLLSLVRYISASLVHTTARLLGLLHEVLANEPTVHLVNNPVTNR